jgi:Na+/melibiose symporter-like transporter
LADFFVAGEATDEQPEAVVQALRYMITLFPAGMILVSFAVIAFYPIGKKQLAEIQSSLGARKGLLEEPLISDETEVKSYG